MSERNAEGLTPSNREISAQPFKWPEEFTGFVEKEPASGTEMVAINADGSISPTASIDGSSYYHVEKGFLSGNSKLAGVENVPDGQFGGPGRRITFIWEPQRGYSKGYYPSKGSGDQERTDIWYDNSGRPIARRAAEFDIDKEGVPYIQKPNPEKIRYIQLFRYGKSEKGEDTVQTVGITRGQRDIDRDVVLKDGRRKTPLRWSKPQLLASIRQEFILPPRK